MGSTGNPNPWSPYNTYKDCSLGICSVYCPQWCYIVFPPPPPPPSDDDGGRVTYFSPLVIAVIGILASAFLLVAYYTLVTKYCRRRRRHRQGDGHQVPDDAQIGTADEASGQIGGRAAGLEESAIKSITVYKYRTGDGLVEGTDCSVCLSEFEENESLRLLPKCNHAFHLPCIDTWLRSNASCPLCRSNIALFGAIPPAQPPAAAAAAAATGHRAQTSDVIRASSHAYCRTTDAAALVIQEDRRLSVQDEAVISLSSDGRGRTSALLG